MSTMDKLQTGLRLLPPFMRFSPKYGDLEERDRFGRWHRITGRREHIVRWRAAQHVRDFA